LARWERLAGNMIVPRGDHYIMIRPDRRGLLSIPMHNPIKRGTMRKLIREAGLTVEEFLKLL